MRCTRGRGRGRGGGGEAGGNTRSHRQKPFIYEKLHTYVLQVKDTNNYSNIITFFTRAKRHTHFFFRIRDISDGDRTSSKAAALGGHEIPPPHTISCWSWHASVQSSQHKLTFTRDHGPRRPQKREAGQLSCRISTGPACWGFEKSRIKKQICGRAAQNKTTKQAKKKKISRPSDPPA